MKMTPEDAVACVLRLEDIYPGDSHWIEPVDGPVEE